MMTLYSCFEAKLQSKSCTAPRVRPAAKIILAFLHSINAWSINSISS